jgi:hypothetical protein
MLTGTPLLLKSMVYLSSRRAKRIFPVRGQQEKLLIDLWIVYGCLRLGIFSRDQARPIIRSIRDRLTPNNRKFATQMFATGGSRIISYDRLCCASLN